MSKLATILLTESEARDLVNATKGHWRIMAKEAAGFAEKVTGLHDREGWRALGYPDWSSFVGAELPFTLRHTYDLIDKGRALLMLTEAGYDSPSVTIAEAKEVKRQLFAKERTQEEMLAEFRVAKERGEDPRSVIRKPELDRQRVAKNRALYPELQRTRSYEEPVRHCPHCGGEL